MTPTKYKNYVINANYNVCTALRENGAAITGGKKGKRLSFLPTSTDNPCWEPLFNSIHKNFGGKVAPGGAIQDHIVNYLMQSHGYGSQNGRPKDPAGAKMQAGIAFSRLKILGIASELK